jgi:hypothetical protein
MVVPLNIDCWAFVESMALNLISVSPTLIQLRNMFPTL